MMQFLPSDTRPNVLFLVVDDFRPALGSYGEKVKTPNLDQLAAQSVRFTDARAQVSKIYKRISKSQTLYCNL